MKIIHVVGARPNFMKVAPVMRAMEADGGIEQLLVHTGQHYDPSMSEVFFQDLNLPKPDIHLGVGSGSHAEQTAKVMVAFEKVCLEHRPDAILVAGDVNSTLACAVDAAKLCIPTIHLEAGLRSNDAAMPEEVNRIVTDRLSSLLLTPSRDGDENLLREGVAKEKIRFVGNVMIDSLVASLDKARAQGFIEGMGLKAGGYGVLTLHRPSNVDDEVVFRRLFEVILWAADQVPIVFPVHPRTKGRMEAFGLWSAAEASSGLRLLGPAGYLDFLNCTSQAKFIITDSGGLQEESTALRIPCLTMRENTERPVTVSEGSNIIVGTDATVARQEIEKILQGKGKSGQVPEYWEGRAAERVSQEIRQWWAGQQN